MANIRAWTVADADALKSPRYRPEPTIDEEIRQRRASANRVLTIHAYDPRSASISSATRGHAMMNGMPLMVVAKNLRRGAKISESSCA
jgi:hypothetical protein